jgi:hypothetical protein
MQNLQFCSASGEKYRVELPAPLDGLQSAYLFSFHKSGSTLMDNMIRRYCKYSNVPSFSLFNSAFDSGIPTSGVMKDAAICFSKTGRIYTGFRHYPMFALDLTGVACVLLVRDPRDMLVSMYYSVAKSHVLPKGNLSFIKRRRQASRMTVDEFAIKKAPEYKRSLQIYREKLPAATLTTYRYEDVIYEKEVWLKDLVEKLGLPQNDELIRSTARKFDVFPEQENENEHIRQVHPGNYKRKLKQETIAVISETLEEFLDYYNYS